MAKKAKNPAQLTDNEVDIVNRIVTLCVAKTYHFIRTQNDPKKYADQILKLSKFKKNFLFSDIILGAVKMKPGEILFPKDQNIRFTQKTAYYIKDVEDAILDLEKKSSIYLKSWEVTEVDQQLVKIGIFDNFKGKNKIRQEAPGAFPRLRKGQGYEKSKREGYFSAYKVTEDLAALNKVVSNPRAREHIHKKLKEYEAIMEFFIFKGLAAMYALRRGDENMFQFATTGSQAILDNNIEARAALREAGLDDQQIQHSAWPLIKSYLLSLKEEELEQLVKASVEYLLENPIDDSYLLLAISKV
jgi:hypothetical protein